MICFYTSFSNFWPVFNVREKQVLFIQSVCNRSHLSSEHFLVCFFLQEYAQMVCRTLITGKEHISNFIVTGIDCLWLKFLVRYVHISFMFHNDCEVMCNNSNLLSLVVSFCLFRKTKMNGMCFQAYQI